MVRLNLYRTIPYSIDLSYWLELLACKLAAFHQSDLMNYTLVSIIYFRMQGVSIINLLCKTHIPLTSLVCIATLVIGTTLQDDTTAKLAREII